MSVAQLSGGGGGFDPGAGVRSFVPVTWHYYNAPPASITISDLIIVSFQVSSRLYDLQPNGTYAAPLEWGVDYTIFLRADIDDGGSYGPALVYTIDESLTAYSATGPMAASAPTEATIAALMPTAASVEFSDSTGTWVVCFNGRDPTALVDQWVGVPPGTPGNIARWSMEPNRPHVMYGYGYDQLPRPSDSVPGTHYLASESSLLFGGGATMFQEGPPSPQCITMQGGGEPGEPWTPPIDYPTFEEFEAPELPEDPPAFVPPQLGAPTVEGEMPEGFETAAVEDHLQSALDRWRARLGLPNHNTILSTGAANVDFDVLQFDFQVGDIHVPISIDFGAWRPQLSLFGYFVNVAAVVWVLCGVYDAVRRA